ncbi:transposase [Gemmata sp. G18]|uniref:Transposase n=1 Tax=Gemmata palustris TaxID=2822762 RepID=A0ABS5C3A3_9BACT|nr:transposase [Gemmata palustris]
MPRPRTTYTAEYKLAAVKMITDQKLSVAEVARRLDVSETLLRAGARRFSPVAARPFPVTATRHRPTTRCAARAENARLKAERDLLKKLCRQA